jgi:hypothetical protein
LEWVHVRQLNYWHSGRGKPKRRHEPPPKDIVFFKFHGGVGAAVAAA